MQSVNLYECLICVCVCVCERERERQREREGGEIKSCSSLTSKVQLVQLVIDQGSITSRLLHLCSLDVGAAQASCTCSQPATQVQAVKDLTKQLPQDPRNGVTRRCW